MNIWIIQNCERAGPFPEFEIRRMIEAGELDGDTPAWHEKLNDWQTLAETGIFGIELNPAPRAEAPPPLPPAAASPHLIRRFWARWLDLYLYGSVWWLAMWVTGRDISGLLTNAWIMMLHYLPWFALEAWLIHRFATTPGKWLLGLKVLNLDGSRLSLQASTRRAARVLFMGIGFGVQLLSVVCMLLGWITTKSLGRPLWDRAGGHFLDGIPLHPARIPAYLGALLLALWLQMIVLIPHLIEVADQSLPPAQAEALKQNPPWHLPKRP